MNVMDKQLFRKSSIDRISSPEQLNDYVRVSNPSVWMILAAIIMLLVGICVWGIFGRLETKIESAGICENGVFTCYVNEEKMRQIESGMTVNVDGNELSVSEISEKPISISADMDGYLLYLGGFSEGEWLYEVTAASTLPDGTYKAEIVTSSVSPMSFILN